MNFTNCGENGQCAKRGMDIRMKFSQIKYNRPDFDLFFQQLNTYIEKFKLAKDAEGQISAFQKFDGLVDSFNTQYALARIRNYMDTNDEFYRTENLLFSKKHPLMSKTYNEMDDLMLNSRFKDELTNHVGKLTMINAELFKTTVNEHVIEDQREENRLVLEYVKLISKLSVEWDGKAIPLTMLTPYKESRDRDIRIRAYVAEGDCYCSVKGELDELFDQLVKNRTEQAKKLGFNNFVELGYARMKRNCYGSEEVKVFREQVQSELVPVVKRIQSDRCDRLGLSSLCFHDLLLPYSEGAPTPQVKPDKLLELGIQMYSKMSAHTKEFIEFMVDNELFDLYSRLGKAPGGFCSFIKDYNYPFIFSNFNGTSQDVNVFTHEAGHAFAQFMSGKGAEYYSNPSMDVSECCSMSMEFLTGPWHGLFFGENTDKYQQMHLENALIFLPYACQVDEFQHYIYENPTLTPSQRDEYWLEIERKYRPGIDYNELPFYSIGGGWQRQTHIYKTPFYYIDYALAQVTALNFHTIHQESPEKAFDLYMKFLSKINEQTYIEILETIGFGSPLKSGSINALIKSLNLNV